MVESQSSQSVTVGTVYLDRVQTKKLCTGYRDNANPFLGEWSRTFVVEHMLLS